MEYLYNKIEKYKKSIEYKEVADVILCNLSPRIKLREYQNAAFSNFITFYENKEYFNNSQIHTLFHMATGSGKTVIMAGLILYLYSKGYRKFLFFVNQKTILEKTIDNFLNPLSNKYLFREIIEYLGNRIRIKKVDNFSGNNSGDIEILFTTTQKLHIDLSEPSENSLTYEDFEYDKIVFISDESHHINSMTKKMTEDEKEAEKSWEYSITNALFKNKDNIMLEFTATCDLKDKNISEKYKDKIIFNYPLISFKESGYTKDFQNFVSDTDLWTRVLMALIMSEYRKFLFSDLKLNIKPVIMLKSQKIVESQNFYIEFFKKIKELTTYDLLKLEFLEITVLNEAINYFKKKDKNLEILKNSIQNSFTQDKSIIMNGLSDNNKENQLLVNSLEDLENPIRIVFAVDMLNEGWDVLNLYDIVRLYDTEQRSNKVGAYTIKEAQLIGRGARYFPFVYSDEKDMFKRKFDNDVLNKNRILETMYFHSKNDSKYISDLKQALIEIGLLTKENLKKTNFYQKRLDFSNKKVLKKQENIIGIEANIKNKIYQYKAISRDDNNIILKVKNIKFKDIDYNVLIGAIECFEELRFDLLKKRYQSLNSIKEFLLGEDYLGNSQIKLTYFSSIIRGKDLFAALKYALSEIVSYIVTQKY